MDVWESLQREAGSDGKNAGDMFGEVPNCGARFPSCLKAGISTPSLADQGQRLPDEILNVATNAGNAS
jgi:hypothetical protein